MNIYILTHPHTLSLCLSHLGYIIEQTQLEPPIFISGPAKKLINQIQMILIDVDGSLASLSEHKGFRRFFVANANVIGITGTIQRLNLNNVRIVFEADSQGRMDAIAKFLYDCIDLKMIRAFKIEHEVAVSIRSKNFCILTDFSSGVTKGHYSEGDDFDKVSVSSSNAEVSVLK